MSSLSRTPVSSPVSPSGSNLGSSDIAVSVWKDCPGLGTTTKWQIRKSSCGALQVGKSRNASSPIIKNNSMDGSCCACRSWTVSMEYDFPVRRSSMSDTSNSGVLTVARRTISNRWVTGASESSGLWGGSPVGMKRTRESCRRAHTRCAMAKWQLWIGLKLPPNKPRRMRQC